MSKSVGQKRRQPEPKSAVQALAEAEQKLYEIIRSKEGMGIWRRDLTKQSQLPDNAVTKSLKTLAAKGLVKVVEHFQNKGKRYYMATEFDPSEELTGGTWYAGGKLDTGFINTLRQVCQKHISKQKAATLEGVTEFIKKTGVFNNELSKQQIDEILRALVLDDVIVEVKSNGLGEFSGVPVGKVCYKCVNRGNGEPIVGAMASVPCGVCPRISQCTPGGVISPENCVYYTRWLEF